MLKRPQQIFYRLQLLTRGLQQFFFLSTPLRKAILLLVLFILIILPVSRVSFSQTPAEASSTYRGDINEDGQVNIFDLLVLLKVLGGAVEPSPSSDLDENGKTDIFDLIRLLRVLGGEKILSEEMADETQQINSTANEIISAVDVDIVEGDSTKFSEIANSLKDLEGVKEVTYTNSSIYVEDQNNIMHVWVFNPLQEADTTAILSGFELPIEPLKVLQNKKALLINTIYEDPGFSYTITVLNSIKVELQQYGYTVSTVYGQYADVDFFRNNLKGTGFYFLLGHGGAHKEDFFHIQTGEEVPDNWASDIEIRDKYGDDLINKRVCIATVSWGSWLERLFNKKRFFSISNLGIDNFYEANDFDGAFIYCAACQGLKNEAMAEAFTEKGAETYAGWTETQSISVMAAEKLVNAMGDGSTLEDAIDGLEERDKKQTIWGLAELKFYPEDTGGDIQLTSVPPTPGDTTVIQGITLVSIPDGTFQMGSTTGSSNERPVHQVTVSAFQMSRYEITQAQYQAVIGSNPAYFSGANNPVEQVSWYDAVTFCNKLSEAASLQPCYDLSTWACDISKNGFRLPTEAEWEYACRAGTTTNYYTGDSESDLDRAGWYYSNSSLTTHAVGGKEANAFGLYDMHGNVWEWCNDWYSSNYYSQSENATNPQGPQTGSGRVSRGGSWDHYASHCRSAYRYGHNPPPGSHIWGFRVVRR